MRRRDSDALRKGGLGFSPDLQVARYGVAFVHWALGFPKFYSRTTPAGGAEAIQTPPAWGALREELSEEELEELVGAFLLAGELGIAPSLVESVKAIAANVARAQNVRRNTSTRRARRLVKAST